MAKILTSSLFLLDAFQYCFFSKFWWFLVCKTTFKGLYETLQKRLCHARTVHPLKQWAHPSFEKFQRLNQIFTMWLSETQTKIKIGHTFTHVWCSCSKLRNVFDEAFLFDVSIGTAEFFIQNVWIIWKKILWKYSTQSLKTADSVWLSSWKIMADETSLMLPSPGLMQLCPQIKICNPTVPKHQKI